jgi:hypothetical protein
MDAMELALAGSPFALLDAHSSVRLVTDRVHEDDALSLALACRALRDALWARFPRRPAGAGPLSGKRLRTAMAAAVATVGRAAWARGFLAPSGTWDRTMLAQSEPGMTMRQPLWNLLPREPDRDSHARRTHWPRIIFGIFYTAARHGSAPAVLRWAIKNETEGLGHVSIPAAAAAAAEGGHLAVLQWLRKRSFPWDARTATAAAAGGHLAVLRWARTNACEWNAHTCSEAARGGHLALLQWAWENGCPWRREQTCSEAAEGGHLAVLQWARADGCTWGTDTAFNAAQGGHLAVLRWARENGCPWERRHILAAWTRPKGSPICNDPATRAWVRSQPD